MWKAGGEMGVGVRPDRIRIGGDSSESSWPNYDS